MLQMVALCPHPAIIIPEIGKEELNQVTRTVNAMSELSMEIKKLDPELIIFITPHGAVFRDAITIPKLDNIAGSFRKFGADISLRRKIAGGFRRILLQEARQIEAVVVELDSVDAHNYSVKLELDHGILVPLYYLNKAGVDTPILPINMGMLPYYQLYEFGMCLQKAIAGENKKAVVIISGDFSHRLTPDAPAGFDPQGKVFDEIVVQSIAEGDVLRLFNIDHKIINKAGECGLRPLVMGLGALDGFAIRSKVYSYEGPFGVGYLVAEIRPDVAMESRILLEKIKENDKNRMDKIRAGESWLVKWARENLESYLKTGRSLAIPDEVPPEFKSRQGVFVSIKKDGHLRGCIGTIRPTKSSIVEEVQDNVLKAALEDPRFEPVEEEELTQLIYSVDVLATPESIDSIEQLDPETYGVIVKKGLRQGLLLPKLEGIENVEEQVAVAKQKAGIRPQEEVEMERFKVTRYD
ncbi:MAG: AmmeMemoRadiSam system protein A [Peptococcaceae bacterium]